MCSTSSHGECSKPRALFPRSFAGSFATAASNPAWASSQPRARERCCLSVSSFLGIGLRYSFLARRGSSTRNAVVPEVRLEIVHLVLEIGDRLLHDVTERDHPDALPLLVEDRQMADVVLRHRLRRLGAV